MIPLNETSTGVTFAVRVHPRAKKNAITGVLGDALKVSLTSPPIEGRANDACVDFLAKLFGVARSYVSIVSGEKNRNKVVCIAGLSANQVRLCLATKRSVGCRPG